MTRAEYLKHYAEDEEGQYIGSDKRKDAQGNYAVIS
jgi:hypothetical protein